MIPNNIELKVLDVNLETNDSSLRVMTNDEKQAYESLYDKSLELITIEKEKIAKKEEIVARFLNLGFTEEDIRMVLG